MNTTRIAAASAGFLSASALLVAALAAPTFAAAPAAQTAAQTDAAPAVREGDAAVPGGMPMMHGGPMPGMNHEGHAEMHRMMHGSEHAGHGPMHGMKHGDSAGHGPMHGAGPDNGHAGHGPMMAAAAGAKSPGSGSVKKVDKAGGTLTIAHGPLPGLAMPAMTMSFPVKDKAWLDQYKAGDAIRFTVEQQGDEFVVVQIEKVK